MQPFANAPVIVEVGIPADRRCEVTVLARREPEVAEVHVGVAGPRERTQRQAVDEPPPRRIERGVKQRLERARRLGDRPHARQAQRAQHGVQLGQFGWAGRLVHPIEHPGAALRSFVTHAPVGEQHELLDQLVALEVRASLELDRHAALVHPRLDLGHVEIEGARGPAARPEPARQRAQALERLEHRSRQRRLALPRRLHLRIGQAMRAAHHRLGELHAVKPTPLVQLHQDRERQAILALPQRAEVRRQAPRQHGNDAARQIAAETADMSLAVECRIGRDVV